MSDSNSLSVIFKLKAHTHRGRTGETHLVSFLQVSESRSLTTHSRTVVNLKQASGCDGNRKYVKRGQYVLCCVYHLCSCLKPDTSVGDSAGSGYGLFGRSGSSSGGNKSTWHCSAGCDGRNPEQKYTHINTVNNMHI